jgi:ABC-type transporter Mla MlaB component/anti-sigma regulatory factor (Ser/Thr protein kinase)
MYRVDNQEESIFFEISSLLKNVDRIAMDTIDFLQEIGEYDTTELIQVIKELTLNAIEHGNQNDISKIVKVHITVLDAGRILLQVYNDGKTLPLDLLPIKGELDKTKTRSRGLIIVNSLVDDIVIAKDSQSIITYVTLTPKFDWGVDIQNNQMVIKPTTDLTASVINELRIMLIDWLDNDVESCDLDLTNVNNLDSVTLSLFIAFYNHLKESSKVNQFQFSNVSTPIIALFQLTQINTLFAMECA